MSANHSPAEADASYLIGSQYKTSLEPDSPASWERRNSKPQFSGLGKNIFVLKCNRSSREYTYLKVH